MNSLLDAIAFFNRMQILGMNWVNGKWHITLHSGDVYVWNGETLVLFK